MKNLQLLLSLNLLQCGSHKSRQPAKGLSTQMLLFQICHIKESDMNTHIIYEISTGII